MRRLSPTPSASRRRRVVGLAPAAPFELSASFYPYLSTHGRGPGRSGRGGRAGRHPGRAGVGLVGAGQTIALKVEQQLPTTPEIWTEVRPDAVTWTVPPGLVFAEAAEGLRPAVTGPERTSGEFELQAKFGGKQAICLITMKAAGPDPNDPEAKLVVVREPGGEYLAVGERQRYAIVVEKGEAREPAAQIAWPDDFENEFVRWQAPVLTAKKAGYRQWLRAEVGGRAVLWHTTTYQPGAGQPPAPDPDRPGGGEHPQRSGPARRFPGRRRVRRFPRRGQVCRRLHPPGDQEGDAADRRAGRRVRR